LFTGDRQRAVQALGWAGWDPALPTVYVTGGAQGSAQINGLIEAILDPLLHQANVVHQSGQASLNRLRQRAASLPTDLAGRYQPLAFVGPELSDVLALADVVVSRSGAGTLAELTALGKPSILIPLVPSGGNEQTHNARHLHQAGAAHALLADHPAPRDLMDALGPVLADEQIRAAMADRAAQLGRPHAAADLAAVLVDLAVAAAEEPALR
jgi:UDP-N-acetylglucosamine--N-acetylmuramyl-(pentapeptide) pyrophosphoryl-undecaprenol N-acetylglucosamine transferase